LAKAAYTAERLADLNASRYKISSGIPLSRRDEDAAMVSFLSPPIAFGSNSGSFSSYRV
jgi:hypothetical protein